MDLPNILNEKNPALQQHLAAEAARVNGQPMSDTASERGISPRMPDHSSKYSSRPDQSLHNIQSMPNTPQYADSPGLLQPYSMVANAYPTPTGSYDNGYNHAQTSDDQRITQNQGPASEPIAQVKAFACTNCGKGFARRSDLARHERIHTGVRPHVCEWPSCGKQFIQRSALTVHARVHTGEKPHMCEHCTKPFSDSSSLARHRRIHSGKRPYKCPYADCQKTFTRRTTLTRHQSHHTGTVEEAAAATAAALASRPPAQRTRSDGGNYSEGGSPRSTPSPGHRAMPDSPASDMPHVPMLARQQSDFSFMAGRPPLPLHMRGDMQMNSPRSSPSSASPSLSNYAGSQQRPSMTSHPAMYGPPPTLEPPTHQDSRSNGSANGSPQLGSMGWQSPSHMASPLPQDGYMYPAETLQFQTNHLYHQNSNMRRPNSTEPDYYDQHKIRPVNEIWQGQM